MRNLVSIWFFLLVFGVSAQDDINQNPNDDESSELVRLTNKGIFVNTSLGTGVTIRKSNVGLIDDKVTLGMPISVVGEVGIFENLRLGLTIQRDGNRLGKDDSLRVYSLSYGGTVHYRFINNPNSFYYARIGFGGTDLQINSIFFHNNTDSTLLASRQGKFLNLSVGAEYAIQPGVNFFYHVKFGMLFYPKMVRLNIYDIERPEEIIYKTPASTQMRVDYQQIYFELGLSFKL